MTAADAPAGPLLVDQLRFMATVRPDEVAYEDIGSGEQITFSQWEARSNQAARWLVAARRRQR